MNRTPIEWCRTYGPDGSFEEGFSVNPVRFRPLGTQRLVTMCQKVSPGCKHCYAEGITRRFWPKDALMPFPGYTATGVTEGSFVLDEKTLLSVLKRKQPAKVFWGDMTDLFQDGVTDDMLDRCFAICALTPHLTHMFLTKRPQRMREYLASDIAEPRIITVTDQIGKTMGWDEWILPCEWPLPNVWLGTSVESNEYRRRIVDLVCTPAVKHFISAEPLVGELDLHVPYLQIAAGLDRYPFPMLADADRTMLVDLLDWVIVGGESGSANDISPMHPDWARLLQGQCVAAGKAFFFKQHGNYGPGSVLMTTGEQVYRQFESKQQWINKGDTWVNGGICLDAAGKRLGRGADFDTCVYPVTVLHPVSKKEVGRKLDGREWNEFPEGVA